MTRSERFSPLLRIAETKKHNAARVATKTKQKLHEYERKLVELRSFREEYTMAGRVGSQSISAMQLQERQLFIRQLDEGINILTIKIEGQRQNSALDRQAWHDAYVYSNTIDKLISKIQKIELNMIETREDNELDDRSQYHSVKN